MNAKTTLADLLELNLHNYEEEVKTIVDKSVKEATTEKTLDELKKVWDVLEFGVDQHERTKLKLLKISEEVIETLEDNQAQLQNLMSNKYVEHFRPRVAQWQNWLTTADQVRNSWFEVQRKWMYLESIFIGSEDIRKQLPVDSKRFDNVDKEFKVLHFNKT